MPGTWAGSLVFVAGVALLQWGAWRAWQAMKRLHKEQRLLVDAPTGRGKLARLQPLLVAENQLSRRFLVFMLLTLLWFVLGLASLRRLKIREEIKARSAARTLSERVKGRGREVLVWKTGASSAAKQPTPL